MFSFLLAALLAPAALAGSGPWVLGQGDHTLYLGVEAQRFDHLALAAGSGADDVLEVGEGMSTLGVKAIATLGLLPRTEVELSVPWYEVRQNRPEAFPCEALQLDACKTSRGIGIVRGRLKLLLLDEILGAPLTATAGAELRLGQPTAEERERITNLGEGSLDAGGFLALGRSGGLGGQGYWSAYLEGGGRYRSSNATVAGDEAPGAETWGELQWLLAPNQVLALGPEATLLWRPSGVDVDDLLADEALLLDTDRLAALRILSVQAGAKLIIRGSDTLTFSAGLLRTAYAINNPTDVWTVDLGLSARGFLRRPRAVAP